MSCLRSLVWMVIAVSAAVTVVTAQNGQLEKQVDSTETPPSSNSLTRCYGKYGCFSVGEPFLSIQRPLNLFPLPPESLNVQFFLRTRRNNEYYQRLKSGDADSFADSKFDSTRPTMFIIHGYLEHAYLKWILVSLEQPLVSSDACIAVRLRKACVTSSTAQDGCTCVTPVRTFANLRAETNAPLKLGCVRASAEYTVVTLLASVRQSHIARGFPANNLDKDKRRHVHGAADQGQLQRDRWSTGRKAAQPPYTQAVANARMVGALVADMIMHIQDRYSVAGSDFHLIGYNVGAHIAGYAGERVKGIGRITGLDPADPYFANTDKVVRLDPSDADFVDVIHTGGSSFDASPSNQYHVQIGVSSTEETRKQHGNRGNLYVHLQGSRPEASLANVVIRFVFCGEGTFLQPNVAKTLFTGGSCEFEVGSSGP
ncbi:hypothetical protein MRX96_017127 [Rhipicephalus microplus]